MVHTEMGTQFFQSVSEEVVTALLEYILRICSSKAIHVPNKLLTDW